MTSLPLTINIAPPAPVQPPAQNASAPASQNQPAAQNQFDAHINNNSSNTSTPAQQSQNRNNAPANNNSSANGSDNHFSKPLDSKQGGNANAPAPANASGNASTQPASGASADGSADTKNDAADTSADAATTSSADTAAIVALIVQLQSQQSNSAAGTVVTANMQASADTANAQNATSASDTESQTSLNDLLNQLTTLLQHALGQQNAASSAATTATVAQTATASTGAAKSTGDKKETDTPQDLSAMIQALLQQINQTTAQPSATTASDATAAVGDSSGAGAASNSALADALNKLAALLDQQAQTPAQSAPQGAAPASDDQDNADQDSDTPAIPATVEAQNAALATSANKPVKAIADVSSTDTTNPQPAPDKHVLEQAVQNVIDALTNKDGTTAKPDDKANVAVSANANTATAPVAAPAPQAPQTSDFAKQLQQAAPQASAPDQVLVHIKNAVSDGSSSISIQLHPEDLGKVDVQLNTGTDGKTNITITSDNRQTLAMLQNEARSLQDALRNIGLKTDAGGLNFNLRDSGQDARNSSKQQQGGYTNVAAVGEVEDTGFSTAGSLYRISVQQGLDIHV